MRTSSGYSKSGHIRPLGKQGPGARLLVVAHTVKGDHSTGPWCVLRITIIQFAYEVVQGDTSEYRRANVCNGMSKKYSFDRQLRQGNLERSICY